MAAKPIFHLVADAIKKELEPQGFHVDVRVNKGEIKITDVVLPNGRGLTWTVAFQGGPTVET